LNRIGCIQSKVKILAKGKIGCEWKCESKIHTKQYAYWRKQI